MKISKDKLFESFKRFIRYATKFAWNDMLYDVSRAEWKFGRYGDGKLKDWTEWENIRSHLKEVKYLKD